VSDTASTSAGGAAPCTDPRASEFDFWLGEWAADWGEQGRGANHVTKGLGGCVILENFRDLDPGPEALVGMSVSTFVARENRWRQTWVDNQGAYLDFMGGMAGGRMALARQTEQDGQVIHQRMVWYDIKPDKFGWNWDRSEDGGKTWKTIWHIHYTRAAPAEGRRGRWRSRVVGGTLKVARTLVKGPPGFVGLVLIGVG
jgi:hypothetical protein